MEKRNSIVLTVIAVATLLVAVVGATFAYFTASVGGSASDANSTSTINTATIASVVFSNADGDSFTLDKAFPGAKGVQSFKISLSGDNNSTGKFVVKLTPDSGNTLLSNVRFTLYRVANNNDTNKIEVINAAVVQDGNNFYQSDEFKTTGNLGTALITNQAITSNSTVLTLDTVNFTLDGSVSDYTYFLAYEYVNDTGASQNTEQNKTFSAKVSVELMAPTA